MPNPSFPAPQWRPSPTDSRQGLRGMEGGSQRWCVCLTVWRVEAHFRDQGHRLVPPELRGNLCSQLVGFPAVHSFLGL